ncbi:hypothetical protein JN11_01278 [Mucilaginibacter frigoritolerans]|uniref:Signal transducing protein n=1 Tax=Mucilaginibacter frigoritolerans TaxID=652788 RepID=A0A562U943_9SPHI|nr:hypothetical protein [Mucilaginibacter frigoritolerans]TWJ02306.1 hypothetical protein JN11_01278 [Mucilaginibacter frigoritolerans]
MESELITYQKFSDIALANAMAEQLDNHHIEYLISEESFNFDPAFRMNNALKEYAVKIKSTDFKKANKVLKDDESTNVAEIGADYYLYAFTNDELKEVITKADEWSAFDNVLALKLLAERGISISDKEIAEINKKRIEELRAPESPQTFYIVIGYLAALLGGIIGMFIGWHLSTYKKTLPDGERVYDYTKNDRMHGKIIFYLSVIVFIIAVFYKIAPVFESNY